MHRISAPTVRTTRLAAAAGFALLGACRVGPDYVPPELDLPDAWHSAAIAGLEGGEADLSRWWTVFEDPVLDELMVRARSNNLDLVIAAQRVVEARALRRISGADKIPTVDMTGDVRRDQLSEARLGGGALPGVTNPRTGYSLGLEAGWELDVWGRIARSVDLADAEIQASMEDYRDVIVLLNAEVALSYVEVRTVQERIRLAAQNVENQTGTLQLTKDRFDAQIAPELDVRQAEMNLSRTEAAVPSLRILLARAQHRLAVLLGEHPGALNELLGTDGSIPDAPERLAVRIPADALRNRPDLRAAERRLAAQVERIGVATAELYPTFGLTGSFGYDGLNSSGLFTSSAEAWSIGIPFRWNVFNRGRIRGNIEIEEARAEALQVDYQRTVLSALEEVENSLVGYGEGGVRVEALGRTVTAAEAARGLVRTLYRTGLTNFQNVLDTERTLANEQDALAQSRGQRIQELVLLYRALGGGWEPLDEELEAGDAEPEPVAP